MCAATPTLIVEMSSLEFSIPKGPKGLMNSIVELTSAKQGCAKETAILPENALVADPVLELWCTELHTDKSCDRVALTN
jgi:hypothetical protein